MASLGISARKGHNVGTWVLSNFLGGQEKQAHICTHNRIDLIDSVSLEKHLEEVGMEIERQLAWSSPLSGRNSTGL